jgi:hypothetical protein
VCLGPRGDLAEGVGVSLNSITPLAPTPPKRNMIAGRRWIRYRALIIPRRCFVCAGPAKVQWSGTVELRDLVVRSTALRCGTGSTAIKLNTRLSLRAPTVRITSSHRRFPGPTVAKPSVKTFSDRRSCLKQGIGLMIRYSSYGGTNYRTSPSAPTKLLCSLEIEYRALQDLRERVRKAEAAARNAPARSKKSALPLIEQRSCVMK